MKQFGIFIQKELYHIFRDRRTLLILLGMPVVLVLLFGFAITNEIDNARIAILDESKGEMSREITQRLVASGYFLIDENLREVSEIEQHFREGKTKMAVVFPPDLQENIRRHLPAQIQLIADATDPNTATTLINYASAIIGQQLREQNHGQAAPMQINTEVKMLYNPRLKSVFMFVPGVMTVILMLVSAMMTSIAITREKELGTMEVLLASPLKPSLIIIGKVIPYILLALANTVVILMLGTFVFGMPVKGSLLLLGLECLLFVVTSLALGILISTRTESQQVAMLISLMALMLPTILLSGFIFPIESMPKVLQVLSNIIPAKWFIIIIKNIMLKGTGVGFVWKESLILTGMALFFIGASVRNFKIRLE
ncbi:MAG: ABC transporter permease [Phaeodactylibacter sp.]|nr:ABC transporter permease [Phaeodactylibacter sp.]MCB9267498.1 ABC transporter permease [Lewinellaceae bacterium]MCB9288091.1 ABC transporter permease [Lewinellaceae bacterium]